MAANEFERYEVRRESTSNKEGSDGKKRQQRESSRKRLQKVCGTSSYYLDTSYVRINLLAA